MHCAGSSYSKSEIAVVSCDSMSISRMVIVFQSAVKSRLCCFYAPVS